MSRVKKILIPLIIALLIGAVISAVLTLLGPGGFSLMGFIGTTVLAWLCLFFLILAWRWGGKGKSLAWMIGLAFGLRLLLGVGLSLALPVFGYDTPTQNAGYIFLDAFQRDQQAWDLAQSGGSVLRAFGSEFFTDQYGGMLAASAGVYRVFSPDVHRPWIILIFTATFGGVGIPFLKRALEQYFDRRIVNAAVWIFALYPESLLLGAAQMRDPILIGLTAIALWGAVLARDHLREGFAVLISSILVMALFSWLVAGPVIAILLILIWVRFQSRFSVQVRRLIWIGIGLAVAAGLAIMAGWLRQSALWDAYLTEQGSGWLQVLFAGKPRLFKIGFLVIYGLAQPVLPAAIFDPSLPLWNGISTFRSLGWYLLLPIVLYLPIGLRKEPAGERKKILVLGYVSFVAWTFISSLRAGGDLWDNPRYRTFFIVFLAITAAWGWFTARQTKDPWLTRLIGVEAVFLIIFGIWYANRATGYRLNLPFYGVVGSIVIISAAIIVGGILRDRRKHPPSETGGEPSA